MPGRRGARQRGWRRGRPRRRQRAEDRGRSARDRSARGRYTGRRHCSPKRHQRSAPGTRRKPRRRQILIVPARRRGGKPGRGVRGTGRRGRLRRRRVGRRRRRRAGPYSQLAEARVDIAVDLLDPLADLFDLVCELLDSPGEVAHLRLEPIHADVLVDRRAGIVARRRRRCAAIHLPLQHVEVALQAIEPLLCRGVLAPGHDRRGQLGTAQCQG